jgi:hypothetical protein
VEIRLLVLHVEAVLARPDGRLELPAIDSSHCGEAELHGLVADLDVKVIELEELGDQEQFASPETACPDQGLHLFALYLRTALAAAMISGADLPWMRAVSGAL